MWQLPPTPAPHQLAPLYKTLIFAQSTWADPQKKPVIAGYSKTNRNDLLLTFDTSGDLMMPRPLWFAAWKSCPGCTGRSAHSLETLTTPAV